MNVHQLKLVLGFLLLSGSILVFSAEAQEESVLNKSDKVDVSDLEQKYWAPKDTDFGVVQNRTYAKKGRPSLSVQGGPVINDSYSEGYALGATANYFFSERYGIELSYTSADMKNGQATDNLKGFGSGVAPDFGRFSSFYGIGFNWVPIYAKMSFLGSKIIYFDMAITPQIGIASYDQVWDDSVTRDQQRTIQQSSFSYGIDVTQYFFLTNHFAIRADLKNRWFQEDVIGYRTRQTLRTIQNHTSIFVIGATYYF